MRAHLTLCALKPVFGATSVPLLNVTAVGRNRA
jgi:hypothetical protein